LSTDGDSTYVHAVEDHLRRDIDYAMLVKMYGRPTEPERPETRYSPAECTGAQKIRSHGGHPDPGAISTSFIGRQNVLKGRQNVWKPIETANLFG
jgi:hypothetical protein